MGLIYDDKTVVDNTTTVNQPNPADYNSLVCDKCGSRLFTAAAAFKRVPGTLFGQAGETITVPVFKTYVCVKCGEIAEHDRDAWDVVCKQLEDEDNKLKDNPNKTSLII